MSNVIFKIKFLKTNIYQSEMKMIKTMAGSLGILSSLTKVFKFLKTSRKIKNVTTLLNAMIKNSVLEVHIKTPSLSLKTS